MVNLNLSLLSLTIIYAAIILGLALLLRRLQIPGEFAVLASSLTFGLVTGLCAALAWPIESSVFLNWPGVLLGDKLYSLSIQILGDSHSSQAHTTIPWLLRIPQVTVVASLLVSGILGGLVQWIVNRRADLNARDRTSDVSNIAESS